ncbi:hypothetical protein B0H10DRAFT_1955000 [Mycena sp. CBHHK59/15]|nr:hypothetical protein B0H10DRAFT_1955000 [Mycena sp. CBHHK59/15]
MNGLLQICIVIRDQGAVLLVAEMILRVIWLDMGLVNKEEFKIFTGDGCLDFLIDVPQISESAEPRKDLEPRLHILGPKKDPGCSHASAEARAEARRQRDEGKGAKAAGPSTKHARSASAVESKDVTAPKKFKQAMLQTYTGHAMPFSASEADAIQGQALRAVISTNSTFGLFEDPEMLTLFGMMRSLAPDIIPWGKVVGGRLLNEAATTVDKKLSKVLAGQELGLLCVTHYRATSSTGPSCH